MIIENIIAASADGSPQHRGLDQIKGIMVHRCGIDLTSDVTIGLSGPEIVDAFLGRVPRFSDVARVTGNQNPYTFYIGGEFSGDDNGRIWQSLPLDEIGHHGRRFSSGYVGVGVIGDFRVRAASDYQMASLIDLLGGLCAAFGWDPYRCIRGHGEVEGSHDGTKSPGQPNACPGDLLNMKQLRYDVEQAILERARFRLLGAGLVVS